MNKTRTLGLFVPLIIALLIAGGSAAAPGAEEKGLRGGAAHI